MLSILVPVEESPSLDAQLESAVLVAEIFNAHVDGTTPSWPIPIESALDSIPAAGPSEWLSAEEQEAQSAAAEQRFRDFVDRRGIAWEDPTKPTDQVTANWLGSLGFGDRTTAELARLYDLTVVGRRIAKSVTPRGSDVGFSAAFQPRTLDALVAFAIRIAVRDGDLHTILAARHFTTLTLNV